MNVDSSPSSPMLESVTAALRAGGCVFAEDEAALLLAETDSDERLRERVRRRVAGEPLEQIVGWAEFCGLRIALEPGVFVPRKRTEFLVEQAIAVADARPVVVDLCCGSGAVAAALATRLPEAHLHAADLDAAACAAARRNLAGRAPVYRGDLFQPLPNRLRGTVDILVANVPYVPSAAISTLPPEAKDHEPRVALDGGIDGLDVARRVVAAAPDWLAAGAHLLFETNEQQAAAAIGIVEAAGLRGRVAECDEWGTTVVIGRAEDTRR